MPRNNAMLNWDKAAAPAVGLAWLTRIALLIVLVIVIARLTMLEAVRDTWQPQPGSEFTPRGPGPTVGLLLDLLALVPVMLVLLRRWLDNNFSLLPRLSHLLAGVLAIWAMLSAIWAADQFAAIISSCHLLAAVAVLWSACQLVRTPAMLRLVSGISLGLLLLLMTHAVMYKVIDAPDLARSWNERKVEILKERGWQPDSFAARQFEQKVLGGDPIGFYTSANTFAAVCVLLLVACSGVAIQRQIDRDGPGWLVALGIATVGTGWLLLQAKSKASAMTPVLAAMLLMAVAMFRHRWSLRPRRSYWVGVGLVALAMLALIGHGLFHGGLFPGHFSNSLQFRWEYWIGSMRLWRQHPLAGVGWDNFGQNYLQFRLPVASEEIKDPHNFLVRGLTELGAVGATILVLWQLRLWWELSVPAPLARSGTNDTTDTNISPQPGIGFAIGAVLAGIFLSIVAGLDPAQYAIETLLRWLMFACVLVLGTIAWTVRQAKQMMLDDRPAPWARLTILAALAVFLIHNLIEFSLFETGPLFAFALLAGSAQGSIDHPNAGQFNRGNRWPAALALAGTVIAAAIGTFMLIVPVAQAESFAREADENIRTRQFSPADSQLRAALNLVPYNADYAIRAARNQLYGGGDPRSVLALLDRATAINPLSIEALLLQAQLKSSPAVSDISGAIEAYQRIMKLNPTDVQLRLSLAKLLEQQGNFADARRQYQLALEYDDGLRYGEPKRLAPEQRRQIATHLRGIQQ